MNDVTRGQYTLALKDAYDPGCWDVPNDRAFIELDDETLKKLWRRWSYRAHPNRPGYLCNLRSLSFLAYVMDDYAGDPRTPAMHRQTGYNADGVYHTQIGVYNDGKIIGFNQESGKFEELKSDFHKRAENV